MNLILKRSGGQNIVLRSQATPRYYPPATTHPARVEVYVRKPGQLPEAALLVGTFAPGSNGNRFPYTPEIDQNVILSTRSISKDGVSDVSNLADAISATLLHQREIDAPTIGQNSPSSADTVEIGITNFTRFARQRRITISANADMSSPLDVLLFTSDDYVSKELPRYFNLQRGTEEEITTESGSVLTTETGDSLEEEVLPATVYVTVAHSGGTVWTPESNILEVTFAADDGTGGSVGDFDPRPRDESMLNI